MIWVVLTVVAVLVVGAVAALATGRVAYDPMAEPTTSEGAPYLPEEFSSADVSTVRFDTALRGYRMDQVDAVLARLQARIAELEPTGRDELHR